MDPIRFGGDIRLLRRERGWTQERLASASARHASADQSRSRRDVAIDMPVERLIQRRAALGAFVSVRLTVPRARPWTGSATVAMRRWSSSLGRRLVAAGWEIRDRSLVQRIRRTRLDRRPRLPSGDRRAARHRGEDRRPRRRWDAHDARPEGPTGRRRSRSGAVGSARTRVPPARVARGPDRTRRRVDQHGVTFATAFPARNVAVTRWLREPKGSLSGLLFLSDVSERHARVDADVGRRRSS